LKIGIYNGAGQPYYLITSKGVTQMTDIRHLAPAPITRIPGGGANNAFIAACHDFDELMLKLQAARALHFGVDPDGAQRNWDNVSNVREMNRQIREALAFITGTAS
jgi:hypothetical protein